jgi:hypothetical protein
MLLTTKKLLSLFVYFHIILLQLDMMNVKEQVSQWRNILIDFYAINQHFLCNIESSSTFVSDFNLVLVRQFKLVLTCQPKQSE